MTVRLAQITDPHVGARWTAADPLDTLRAVIAAVRALPGRIDAVLVTGDIAADGLDEQYELAGAALDELGLAYFVLPGNHDDRAALRRRFPLSGFAEEPIAYEVAPGEGLRVLMLDTLSDVDASADADAEGRAGSGTALGAGALGPERLAWLRQALGEASGTPTLLAMHHPPLLSGVPATDRHALADSDRAAVAEVVAAHPQVSGIVAGHVHRTMIGVVGGRPALTIPSTYGQFPLDAGAERLAPAPEPIGFAVHELVDGRLVSHVQTLAVTA